MSIREALGRLLNRGDFPQDPDELIEIAIVQLPTGPMSVEALRNADFHASGAPTYNIATGIASDYRILVPRHEAAAATRHLQSIR